MTHRNGADSGTVLLTRNESYAVIHLQGLLCLSVRFFDDIELALLVETSTGRYLVTTEYKVYASAMISSSTKPDIALAARSQQGPELWIRRARFISPLAAQAGTATGEEVIGLALNGRKGRRVGCVCTGDGTEVAVWDMEADEDDEEEGAGDEEMTGEEDEGMDDGLIAAET